MSPLEVHIYTVQREKHNDISIKVAYLYITNLYINVEFIGHYSYTLVLVPCLTMISQAPRLGMHSGLMHGPYIIANPAKAISYVQSYSIII